VSLLDRIATFLSDRGITHALIGATALAIHGVSRATQDQDLLVVDSRVLEAEFWQPLAAEAQIEVRRGDSSDPLAGVIRARREGDTQVDVVVGRDRWQEELLARRVAVGDGPQHVVQPADLILLKLYAGGSQDRWDIERLIGIHPEGSILAAVDERVGALPKGCRLLWQTVRSPG
jgi:hypothetical protein